MRFSGKMSFMIILKFTKNQGFHLSLEDTFLEKPQGNIKLTPSFLRLIIREIFENLLQTVTFCKYAALPQVLFCHILTLIIMRCQKGSLYQFFLCNLYKRTNYPQKLSDFQFEPFSHTGVKCQGHTQCQPQITELKSRPPIKKTRFFGQIFVKLKL